jgi:hypothetical protein
MGKYIIYITVILFLALACEDVYHPELINVINLPVIEARITNNPAFNYIKLNRTTGFTDNNMSKDIANAKVEVLEEGGPVYSAKHTGIGIYSFTQPLQPGRQYKLRVVLDKETYESTWEKLPALPEIQEFYVGPDTLMQYVPNLYGYPIKQLTFGFQVSVDLPVRADIQNYLFRWHSYLLFTFPNSNIKPYVYEWISYLHNGSENLAYPALYSSNSLIKRHKLMFNITDYFAYANINEHPDRLSALNYGWIFEIDQYGLSDGSFKFFQKLSEQLKADGQLFDPVYSQIPGNMSCTSNPDKLMLGVFDLSSVTRHQYYVTNVEYQNIYYHKMQTVYDIPGEGVSVGIIPLFWQKKEMKE